LGDFVSRTLLVTLQLVAAVTMSSSSQSSAIDSQSSIGDIASQGPSLYEAQFQPKSFY
jgi:hypothetical protein